MNTAFGDPTSENMPFNLAHRRFPIQYELGEDGPDKQKLVRQSLSKDLAHAIKLIFGSEEFQKQKSPPTPRPRTAIDEAKDHAEDVRYESKRSGLDHGSGLEAVYTNVVELFEMIETKCAEINSLGSMHIDVASKVVEHTVEQYCTMTSHQVSMNIIYYQPYRGSGSNAHLRVLEFKGTLILPNETRQMVYITNPEVLKKTTYTSELSRKFEVGWAKGEQRKGNRDFISNDELAENCMKDFIRLVRGKGNKTFG